LSGGLVYSDGYLGLRPELTIDNRRKVTAVGIGSAGIKIVSLLSRKSLLVDKFVFLSCDREDFSTVESEDTILIESQVDQKLTPSMVRGLALGAAPVIRRAIEGSEVVFVVAGLGGATGSGLAPMVASISQEAGATTVGVAVMPFEFEKKLKFYAGVSLRRLRSSSRGVVVVDNDTLMHSSSEDSTLPSLYDAANRAVVKALGSLLSRSSEDTRSIGLNKLFGTVLQDGYALLGVSSSSAADKAEDALAGAVVSLGKLAKAGEATRAVVNLDGDSSLTAREVGIAVERLGTMMDAKGLDVEYAVDYTGSSQLQVSLLASGFSSTKYDDYDPLAKVLGDRILDDEMDAALPLGLESLQNCD
jgi:cell division protein FtsZ